MDRQYSNPFFCRNPDVVERQQMLWDAKYLQLAKHFNLPKDVKAGKQRVQVDVQSFGCTELTILLLMHSFLYLIIKESSAS